MSKEYKRKPGYYHNSCYEGSEIYYFEDEPRFSERDNWYGPFDKFSECKKSAIEYHKVDITTAKNAIDWLKNLKKMEVPKR